MFKVAFLALKYMKLSGFKYMYTNYLVLKFGIWVSSDCLLSETARGTQSLGLKRGMGLKRSNPLLSCACYTPQKETTASQASFDATCFSLQIVQSHIVYTPVFMVLAKDIQSSHNFL